MADGWYYLLSDHISTGKHFRVADQPSMPSPAHAPAQAPADMRALSHSDGQPISSDYTTATDDEYTSTHGSHCVTGTCAGGVPKVIIDCVMVDDHEQHPLGERASLLSAHAISEDNNNDDDNTSGHDSQSKCSTSSDRCSRGRCSTSSNSTDAGVDVTSRGSTIPRNYLRSVEMATPPIFTVSSDFPS